MLMQVHRKILGKINLANDVNKFVEREDSRNQTFRHLFFSRIIHNICKIELTVGTFHMFIFPIKCIKSGAIHLITKSFLIYWIFMKKRFAKIVLMNKKNPEII